MKVILMHDQATWAMHRQSVIKLANTYLILPNYLLDVSVIIFTVSTR
jgi:hypothetical protein